MKMTIEEINEVIGVMTDLFPWANKKQIKEAMAAKLSSMSREDADRSLRPVKTGRTRLIDWIAEEDILAKRDREYAQALAKRSIEKTLKFVNSKQNLQTEPVTATLVSKKKGGTTKWKTISRLETS